MLLKCKRCTSFNINVRNLPVLRLRTSSQSKWVRQNQVESENVSSDTDNVKRLSEEKFDSI